MESVQSKLMKILLRFLKVNNRWGLTGDDLLKYIEKKQSSTTHKPPYQITNKYNILTSYINGYSCYTMKPYNYSSTKHILYFHGGAYVYEDMRPHWRFLKDLNDTLQCEITIPIYPLAPKYKVDDVFNMVLPIYKNIISNTDPNNIIIVGDSAGGGLALSLCQLLKEKGLPQPSNTILISPTLDMTFSNPEIETVEKLDPILGLPALKDIMKWYAGKKGLKHYLVSPLYGDLDGLCKISLFIGTDDILYPDTKKLKELSATKNVTIDYYIYPSMIHVWPFFYLPESKIALNQIIDIIKE